MYSSEDNVVELTASNFNHVVMESKHVWVVEFYANWCDSCRSFSEEYKKLATILEDRVAVGAVNIGKNTSIKERFSINRIPMIIIFGVNKETPILYKGHKRANKIAETVLDEVNKVSN